MSRPPAGHRGIACVVQLVFAWDDTAAGPRQATSSTVSLLTRAANDQEDCVASFAMTASLTIRCSTQNKREASDRFKRLPKAMALDPTAKCVGRLHRVGARCAVLRRLCRYCPERCWLHGCRERTGLSTRGSSPRKCCCTVSACGRDGLRRPTSSFGGRNGAGESRWTR